MNKDSVLGYLENQAMKIDSDDFNFLAWKAATVNFLDRAFGNGNDYSEQVGKLELEEKMSYEELYPKRIIDMPGSKKRFRSVIHELIDQLKPLSEEEFDITQVQESKTLEIVLHSLKYHLRGGQLRELSDTCTASDEEREQHEKIIALVKTYDIEIIQTILSDILASKEIWQHLDE